MTIIPSEIPGLDIDVESIRTNATDLLSNAGSMRTSGSTLKTTWAGMTSCYQAPEQETLYAAMNPVETTSDTLADHLESIASALDTFADTAEMIKSDAQSLQARAQDFLDTTGKDPEWMYDQDNVDAHNGLVTEANALQVRLWDAERECANTIRALDGLAGYHADKQSQDDELYYGMSEIPAQATGMDWGGPVERHDNCVKGTAVSVGRGVYNDSLLGMVNGLTGLIGVEVGGPHGALHWSGDTAARTWQGIAGLIGFKWDEFGDFDGWSPGNAGGAWLGVVQGFVAWDMWKEGPVRAGTVTVVNVGVTVLTVGAGFAASAASRGGVAAARLGRVGRAAQIANTITKFTDPVGLVIEAGVARLGSWVRRVPGVRVDALDLMDAWRNWRGVDVADVDVPAPHSGTGPDAGSMDRTHAPDVDSWEPSTSPDAAPEIDAPPAGAVGDVDVSAPGRGGHGVNGADTSGTPEGRPRNGVDSADGVDGVDSGDAGAAAHRAGARADVPDTVHARPRNGVDSVDGADSGDASARRPHVDADGSDAGAPRADGGNAADGHPFDVEHRPSVTNSVEIGADHSLAPTPRKPFGRGVELEPDTVYQVEGRGDFYTNSDGVVVHVEAGSAATNGGRINPDLNDPLPNATYTVDERFHYTTDEHGRTVRCEVDSLDVVPEADRVRKPHIQNRVGHYGDDLPGIYEGGHLVATRYGGPPESINMVPELREVNRGSAASNGGQGSFQTFESGNQTHHYSNIDIKIEYDANYTGTPSDEVPDTLRLRALAEDDYQVNLRFRNRQ